MKTAFKWFDTFIFILIFCLFIGTIALLILEFNFNTINFPPTLFPLLGVGVEFTLVALFFVGVLYAIIGILFFVFSVDWKPKNVKRFKSGKRMLVKGIVIGSSTFVLFFFLSLALSFFGLSSHELTLPKDSGLDVSSPSGAPVANTSDFPVSDLKIVSRQQDTTNPTMCDITILNSNQTLTTASITLVVNNWIRTGGMEQIAPGKTGVMSVSTDTKTNAPCSSDIVIKEAGTAQ